MRDKTRKIITGGIKSGTTGLISPLARILLHHRIRILFRTPDKTSFATKILLLTANNLYGTSQMLKMPERAFRWLNKDEIRLIDWATVYLALELGYFVECAFLLTVHLKNEIKSY